MFSLPKTPTSGAKGWRVDNWQIPVPLETAIVMDGGTNADRAGAKDQILKALKGIEEKIRVTGWKFSAWVVTHWDEDHYRGMLELLASEDKIRRGSKIATFRDHYFTPREKKGPKPLLYCGGEPPQSPEFANLEKWFSTPFSVGRKVIGLDLFSSQQVFDQNGNESQAADPTIRVTQLDENQPRFCVVGAGGFAVGKDQVYKTGDITSKNETSILALLYWPGVNRGQSSYFTGGDGNPNAELDAVVPFLEANTNRRSRTDVKFNLPTIPVAMMKLDHHGSSREVLNDQNSVIDKFEPTNILVTPGTRYGHPTWDVLWFVEQYFERRKSQAGQLYTTRSPYWMTKDRTGPKDVNPQHIPNISQLLDEDMKALRKRQTLTFHDVLAFHMHSKITSWSYNSQEDAKLDRLYLAELRAKFAEENPNKKRIYHYNLVKLADGVEAKLKEDTARALRDPDMEEPQAGSFYDGRVRQAETREVLRSNARESWNQVSRQPIIHAGNPFYLIRFTFYSFSPGQVESRFEVLDDQAETKQIMIEDYPEDDPRTRSQKPTLVQLPRDMFSTPKGRKGLMEYLSSAMYHAATLNELDLIAPLRRLDEVETISFPPTPKGKGRKGKTVGNAISNGVAIPPWELQPTGRAGKRDAAAVAKIKAAWEANKRGPILEPLSEADIFSKKYESEYEKEHAELMGDTTLHKQRQDETGKVHPSRPQDRGQSSDRRVHSKKGGTSRRGE